MQILTKIQENTISKLRKHMNICCIIHINFATRSTFFVFLFLPARSSGTSVTGYSTRSICLLAWSLEGISFLISFSTYLGAFFAKCLCAELKKPFGRESENNGQKRNYFKTWSMLLFRDTTGYSTRSICLLAWSLEGISFLISFSTSSYTVTFLPSFTSFTRLP